MNLLIIGGGAGSWAMRGRQLGAELGACVTSTPSASDFAWASLVVLVKRAGVQYAHHARRLNLPIIWDALDFWIQPAENSAGEAHARQMLANQLAFIQPALTIGATEAMAAAAGGVCLPHHSWLGLTPTPARETVRTVAYDGGAVYLGRWHQWLEEACKRRGWTFVVNPPNLADVDILVAFRDGPWDGWICREWKSGVKLVNAIVAGRPIIRQDSAAGRELWPDGTVIEAREDLDAALDAWTGYEARAAVVARSEIRAFTHILPQVAEDYRAILEAQACPV